MASLERKNLFRTKFIMESLANLIRPAKLILAVALLQGAYAGQAIIVRMAMNQGMSHYIFLVYRMAFATVLIAPFALILDRKSRPKMTSSILVKTMLLSLFDPVLDQNLYYMATSYSTATFTSAMFNILPAIAFFMAWIFRLETVNIRKLHSQAKVLGTIITVGGAIILTLTKGAALNLPWTKGKNQHHHQMQSDSNHKDITKSALLSAAACFCWSSFIILQAFTLRSYPCKLSLATLTCFWGLVEGAILALVVEWRNSNADWSIHLDIRLLAAFYGGILSGVAYYIMGMVNKEKGPVFFSAFNPLGTVIIAILGSLVLDEHMYLGSLIGSIVIVVGLYLVLWGKTKDEAPSQLSKTQSQPNDEPITTSQQQMMPEGGLDIEPGGEPKTNMIDS
ncbi:unnamed protein product [Prunus armeniaca]